MEIEFFDVVSIISSLKTILSSFSRIAFLLQIFILAITILAAVFALRHLKKIISAVFGTVFAVIFYVVSALISIPKKIFNLIFR